MQNNVTVVILCGGKGERLRPLTEKTPKPLVHINGRPILSYMLDHIIKFNISNVVIAVGYESDKIRNFFHDEYTSLNVTIVDSGDVDIIERIKACSDFIEDEFILLYGDTLANVDYNELQEYHYSHSLNATLTLYPLKSQFGLVELDKDSNVTNFQEKPTLDKWINIGGFYYDNTMLTKMKEYTSYAEFLEDMGMAKLIKGYKHLGIHITVNTLHELDEAKKNIHLFE